MGSPTGKESPILYWDGDCSFCRAWVNYWRSITGDRVEYALLQEAPDYVIQAAGGAPFQRIVLQCPDGRILGGAAAAVESLATASLAARLLNRTAMRLPWFSQAAETVYAFVARHRSFFGRATQVLWGPAGPGASYRLSGWIFPRLMGAVWLSAFLSLWVQIDGLAGSKGILPVADHLDAIHAHFSNNGSVSTAYWQVPSLLWFGASDTMLHVWLAVGAGASLLLMVGLWPALCALIAWAVYLSFVSSVPIFLNYQWDALLLEAGLLLVLFVPWRARLTSRSSAPPAWGRLLVWWLLFRLMFESGVVKLFGFDAEGRNTWLDGTALNFHYFTQPIPVWTSWWMEKMPDWFHRASLGGVFFIELILPFFIFGPRRLRQIAFAGFTFLMLLIMLTGHYGFFNLLTLALAVTLLDDDSWPALLRRRFLRQPAKTGPPLLQRRVLPWLAAPLIFVTTWQLFVVLRAVSPATAAPFVGPLAPLRSANSYGLFSVMTTERPEITIEASPDGVNWQEYRFRYKADAEDNTLPFLLPHMPRLDWQMWFAALEMRASGQVPGWIMPLLARWQERSDTVLNLVDKKSSPAFAPVFFRLRLDNLEFTGTEERAGTGRLWKAEPLPQYTVEGRLGP
jgi:predicted DCC family thiol-disulfide oxidoreductase YuxK